MAKKATKTTAREKRLAKEEKESTEVHGRAIGAMAAGAAISFIPVVGPWIGIPLMWGGIGANVSQSRKDKKREEEIRQRSIVKEDEEEQATLDINTASAKDLQQLPGVGPVLAKRIVQAQPFHSVDDIIAVKGLPKTLVEHLSQFTHE